MDHFFNIFFVFRKILKNLKEGQIVLYITGQTLRHHSFESSFINREIIIYILYREKEDSLGNTLVWFSFLSVISKRESRVQKLWVCSYVWVINGP